MDNVIKISDEKGNSYDVEVLDIFNVVGYSNDYILYTMNKEVDEMNIEAYVSILCKDENGYSLLNISDEKEWNDVQIAISEMEDNNG